jgi:glycerol-3-phosphate acyltransferase PlsY
MTAKTFCLPLIAYLLGSVPWGLILTRFFADVDIRKAGSGNIGAHNVYRLAGTRLGLATLVGDILKGALPVLIASSWAQSGWRGDLWVCLVAFSAFGGHLFSAFLGFKGGKGVATAAGCILVMSPMTFFVCLLVYILFLCISGYSSVGSIAASASLAFAIWPATHSVPITACAAMMAAMIFWRHKDNIRRLLHGNEHSSFGS